jgi:hypothetical protein
MAVNNLNTPGVGIQPSIVDAKGDLIAGTAADAVGRLAVGTNGQQLVADSTASTGLKWDNPSGLVHINTTTMSAVASQSLDGVFSATYENYLLLLKLDNSTTAVTNSLRYRASGSDISLSNYKQNINRTKSSTSSTLNAEQATNIGTSITLCVGQTRTGISFNAYAPFKAENTRHYHNAGGWVSNEAYNTWGGGIYEAATVIDGFSIIASTGTLTGTIRVYGYKD